MTGRIRAFTLALMTVLALAAPAALAPSAVAHGQRSAHRAFLPPLVNPLYLAAVCQAKHNLVANVCDNLVWGVITKIRHNLLAETITLSAYFGHMKVLVTPLTQVSVGSLTLSKLKVGNFAVALAVGNAGSVASDIATHTPIPAAAVFFLP